jgi:hypothetical protein
MIKPSDSPPSKLSIQIPADWTPEQAFAVFELINDLRDAIWQRYSIQLLDEYRDRFQHPTVDRAETDPHDPPF